MVGVVLGGVVVGGGCVVRVPGACDDVGKPVQKFPEIFAQPAGAFWHHDDVDDTEVPQVTGSIAGPQVQKQIIGGSSTPIAIEVQVVVTIEQSVAGTGQPGTLE